MGWVGEGTDGWISWPFYEEPQVKRWNKIVSAEGESVCYYPNNVQKRAKYHSGPLWRLESSVQQKNFASWAKQHQLIRFERPAHNVITLFSRLPSTFEWWRYKKDWWKNGVNHAEAEKINWHSTVESRPETLVEI